MKRFFLSLTCVAGSLFAYENQVSITIEGDFRIITGNGIPNHELADFYVNEPTPQNYRFRVPLKPKQNKYPKDYVLQDFGVAINSVPFDPEANEWWNDDRRTGWQKEPLYEGAEGFFLDSSHAHVQPTGAYHYHGVPEPLLKGHNAAAHSPLLGYAADGFPIYARFGYSDPSNPKSQVTIIRSSYQLKQGSRPKNAPPGNYTGEYVQDYEFVSGSGDLDECNGRFGPTPDHPQGTYAYFLTDSFPFIPRFFRGTPDSSFEREHGGHGGPHDGHPPHPRHKMHR